jgi:hypothetical protein
MESRLVKHLMPSLLISLFAYLCKRLYMHHLVDADNAMLVLTFQLANTRLESYYDFHY